MRYNINDPILDATVATVEVENGTIVGGKVLQGSPELLVTLGEDVDSMGWEGASEHWSRRYEFQEL